MIARDCRRIFISVSKFTDHVVRKHACLFSWRLLCNIICLILLHRSFENKSTPLCYSWRLGYIQQLLFANPWLYGKTKSRRVWDSMAEAGSMTVHGMLELHGNKNSLYIYVYKNNPKQTTYLYLRFNICIYFFFDVFSQVFRNQGFNTGQ